MLVPRLLWHESKLEERFQRANRTACNLLEIRKEGWFPTQCHICAGLARTLYMHGVYTFILAGKSPNVRSYTVLANPTYVDRQLMSET